MPEPGGGEIVQNAEIPSVPLLQEPSLKDQSVQEINNLSPEQIYLQALKRDLKKLPEMYAEKIEMVKKESKVMNLLLRPDIITFFGINAWEYIRQGPLLQQNRPDSFILSHSNPSHLPPLAPDWAIPTLSNMGDLWDGYTYSMLTYYGLTMLNQPFEKKIPEQIKVGISFLVGSAIVVGAESGILHSGLIPNTPDWGDIPAGIVGAVAFAGVKMLNKDFIGKCTESIKKIRNEIRNSPAEKANAEFLRDFDEDEGYYEDFAYASNL